MYAVLFADGLGAGDVGNIVIAIVNNWVQEGGYRCYGHDTSLIIAPRSVSGFVYAMKNLCLHKRRVHQVLDDCIQRIMTGLKLNKTFAMHWQISSMTNT